MTSTGDGLWFGTLGPAGASDAAMMPPPLPVELRPGHALVYDGRLGELYQIFLRNLLLILATCGIYYFWGKVRLRQYVWSRVSLDGHRFEFGGKGGEMFRGFLMILAGLTVWGIATAAIELSAGPAVIWVAPLLSFVTLLAIFYLAFVAQFSAQRYRLTRTRWRGIGGGMQGSSLVYGVKAMLLMALLSITLAQTRPYGSMRLLEHRLNRVVLGDKPVSMIGARAGSVYGRYLLACIGLVVITLVIMFVIGMISRTSIHFSGEMPSGEDVTRIIIVTLITYALVYAAAAWLMAGFWSRFFNHAGEHVGWGDIKLEVKSTTGMFVQHRVVNILAMLLSLGLAYPWALHRVTRYVCQSVVLRGDIAYHELRQTDLQGAAIGEGLLNAFDPGFI